MTKSNPEPSAPKLFTVKQAAERLEISPRLVRSYCHTGLIPNIKRTRAGYRLLDDSQLNQLQDIHFMKRCGFTNLEVHRYFSLARQGSSTIPQRAALLETKKRQLWTQLTSIQQNIDFIERKESLFDQEHQ